MILFTLAFGREAFGSLLSAHIFPISQADAWNVPNAQVKTLPPLFISSLALDKLTNFTIFEMDPKMPISSGYSED